MKKTKAASLNSPHIPSFNYYSKDFSVCLKGNTIFILSLFIPNSYFWQTFSVICDRNVWYFNLKPYSLQKNLLHCKYRSYYRLHTAWFLPLCRWILALQLSSAQLNVVSCVGLKTSTLLNHQHSPQLFFALYKLMCFIFQTASSFFVCLYRDLWVSFFYYQVLYLHGVHCIASCALQKFESFIVVWNHLMFTLNCTPKTFVTQTLNCGIQIRGERGWSYCYKLQTVQFMSFNLKGSAL